MYGNGGYLMLDFKNKDLSATPVKIEGIHHADIIRTKKVIVVNGVKVYSINYPTMVASALTSTNNIVLVLPSSATTQVNITITPTDDVTLAVSQANTLKLESEVNTNASKSDSNISK